MSTDSRLEHMYELLRHERKIYDQRIEPIIKQIVSIEGMLLSTHVFVVTNPPHDRVHNPVESDLLRVAGDCVEHLERPYATKRDRDLAKSLRDAVESYRRK